MARLFVCESGGITIDIDAMGGYVRTALEDDQAEPLLRCAVLMALSSILQGGHWPEHALESMMGFMARMKTEVVTTQLT